MCDVCRKYVCPDGCPNGYSLPRRKRRRKKDRQLTYKIKTRFFPDGTSYKRIIEGTFDLKQKQQ